MLRWPASNNQSSLSRTVNWKGRLRKICISLFAAPCARRATKTAKPTATNEQKKIEATARSFVNVLDQWEVHRDPKWRLYWINEAKKWQDIPGAKAILQKANPTSGA
jgi:hypothetical protein